MQSLTAFFEDNKPLAIAAAAAAVLILLIVVFLLYRALFGRRLRSNGNGRVRQPRLGIVDAYDLDRQRQLVLIRRDNVEHLIMIGGPTDVVVESSIVRAQQSPAVRDKEAGPLVGAVASPSLPGPPQVAPLAPPATAPHLAAPGRTEPPLTAPRPSGERPPPRQQPGPELPQRGESATPRAVSPVGAGQPRPPGPPSQAASGTPSRGDEAPTVVSPGALPPSSITPDQPAEGASPAQPAATGAPAARPPLRTGPRPPLPPRQPLGAGLPPRPRPLQPRPEPLLRPDPGAPDAPPPRPAGGPGPGADPEPRVVAVPSADIPPATPPKTVDTLESLEEEMAKLLGRPAPRRDG